MSFVNVAVGGMAAANAINQGRAARTRADLQAQSLEYSASTARTAAEREARVIRRAGVQAAGSARAGYAGAGVMVGAGSAADTERYITEGAEADAFQALLQGDRQARGMQVEAAGARAAGRSAEAAGWLNAATSVMSGVAAGQRAAGWKTTASKWGGTASPRGWQADGFTSDAQAGY